MSDERGQVVPLFAVVLLTVLLGVAALVIDVGGWLTASRHVQSVADAAALAAVQDLPANPAQAISDATTYATTNGGTLNGTPVISQTSQPNDTITVNATMQAPVTFARAFGFTNVTVHAQAVASAAGAGTIPGTSSQPGRTGQPIPFAVGASQVPPLCGCAYGQTTTVTFPSVAPGNFGLIGFDNSNAAPPTLGSWISNGYPGSLPVGWYAGSTGRKFMSALVRGPMGALASAQTTILVAVYTATNGASGSGLKYYVGGWAAFKLTGFSGGSMTGSWQRLQMATPGTPGQYFGVGKVKLTK